MKRTANVVSRKIVPLRMYETFTGLDVVGLCYHLVSREHLEHVSHLFSYKTPEMFESDLLHLKNHYQPISYDQLMRYLASGNRIPPRAVFLSFDDGYSECFNVVRPLLLKYEMTCTFFVPTDFVGNQALFYRNKVSLCIEAMRRLKDREVSDLLGKVSALAGHDVDSPASFVRWIKSLDWKEEHVIDRVGDTLGVDFQRFLAERAPYLTSSQVRQLASDGFTIGAHGTNHRALLGLKREEIEIEITHSCRRVQEWTGKGKIPFAFPFSADGVERDWLEQIVSEDESVGLLFGSGGVKKDRDFIINRVLADLPSNGPGTGTNVPQLLRDAYANELSSSVRTRVGSIVEMWRA